MGEVLSQAEMEAILSSIPPSRPKPSVIVPTNDSGETATHWERYDFRSSAPLRGEALAIVHALHLSFGQRSKPRLQNLLQANVDFTPVGVCRSTSEEFLATLRSPCTICRLGRQSSESNSLLVWSNSLLQSMFARMVGGKPDEESDNAHTRVISPMERRLLSRLNEPILLELAEVFRTGFVVSQVHESTVDVPRAVSKLSCIWLSYELDCGGSRGVIHLGIPRVEIGYQPVNAFVDSDVDSKNSISAGVQKVAVELSACLASLRMRTSDVASLQIGDILMTDLRPIEPIALQMGEKKLWNAVIGTHSGQKALRLVHRP